MCRYRREKYGAPQPAKDLHRTGADKTGDLLWTEKCSEQHENIAGALPGAQEY